MSTFQITTPVPGQEPQVTHVTVETQAEADKIATKLGGTASGPVLSEHANADSAPVHQG